jgi:O-antigen/teichoic acid export membrane protein
MVSFHVELGGFRGAGDAVGRVLLKNVLMRTSIFVGVVVGIALGYGAVGAAAGWVVGLLVTAVGGLFLLRRRTTLLTASTFRPEREQTARLLRFSVPLMGAAVVWELMKETDNLLIGYYLASADLGVYDAAFTISRLLLLFFWPIGFLFLPVLSELDHRGESQRMRLLYQLATKWMTVLSLPLLLAVAFFPGPLLETVFGVEFAPGRLALVVLTVAFFTHVVAGPNRQALTAIGDTRIVLYGTVVALAINVLLNVALVPRFGIEGAAVATGLSYVGLNVGYGYALFRRTNIAPVSGRLVRVSAAGVALFVGLILAVEALVDVPPVRLLTVLALFLPLYAVAFVLLGGFDPQDVDALEAASSRAPVDLSPVVDFVRSRTDESGRSLD